MAKASRALAEHIAAELHGDATWPVVVLDGPDLPGKRDVAARLAAGLGLRLQHPGRRRHPL